MLWESLLYLVTPAPRFARAMRYPQEQIAIAARARRNAAAWASHIGRAQAFVAAAADAAPGRRRAVLLGSGLLMELPVDHLVARFEEVICVDLVHPPWIVRRWRRRAPNLRFLAGDVSGMLERFLSAVQAARVRGGPPALPESRPRLKLEPERCDFVVSANLLTQLAAAPAACLQRMLGADAVAVQTLDAWADQVMRAHLDWLRDSFTAPVCLYADDWRETRDAAGAVVERVTAFPQDAALPAPDEEWLWTIAPRGELPNGETQTRRVKAWRDLFGTAAPAP